MDERRSEIERQHEKKRKKSQHAKAKKIAHKERHWSKKHLNDMTARDWRIFKEDFNITTKGNILKLNICIGGSVPNPIRNWEESGFPKKMIKVIDSLGYKEPTPIQKIGIPVGMRNRDVIGIAETGSGKTAAFILPLIMWVMDLPRVDQYLIKI